MGLTVFLSNTRIQIVSGTGTKNGAKIAQYFELNSPEGSILNGVVTDATALTGALSDFWKAKNLPKKDVRLVVNSQQFIVKVLEIPSRLQKSKSVDYVRHEFSDVERTKEPVIGFFKVVENKATKTDVVCAEMAEYNYLDNYRKLFLDAGITLTGISSAVGVAANMLQRTAYIQSATCVVLLLDGASLTSLLFVKGRYYYSSTTRIFSDHGTPAFGADVTEVVNRLTQFMNAQHIEEKIASIYLAGFADADASTCTTGIQAFDRTYKIERLMQPDSVTSSAGVNFDKIVYPAAGLYIPENEINLIDGLNKKTEKQKAGAERLKKAVPYFIIAGILAAVTVALLIVSIMKTDELNKLNDKINEASLQKNVMSYDEAEAKSGTLESLESATKDLAENISSYPYPNSSVKEIIQETAKGLAQVEVGSYDASTGVLNVTATSLSGGTVDDQVLVINQFIAKLMQEKTFTNVTYTGYSYNDDTKLYDINVSCALSEDAGKGAS